MEETNELCRIEIPNYITHIELTKKRRPVYREDGTIKNSRSLDKPRVKRINGQDLWVGIDPHLRAKMAKELKKYFYTFIKDLEPINKYPISVDMEFHQKTGEYDLDNLSLWYRKCFHDSLTGNVEFMPSISDEGKKSHVANHDKYPPKIPDDTVKFISEFKTTFVEITEDAEPKLIITINAK